MKDKRNYSTLALTIAMSLFVSACGEDTSSSAGSDYNKQPTNETSFNEKALIENLADNVIAPTFELFKVHSAEQASAVAHYCGQEQAFANNTLDSESVAAAKMAAQQQWTESIAVWQQAEVMQIGPLLENDATLRNNIYSWPINNSCAVDYDVMFFKGGTVNGAPYDITKRTPSRKGMAALEYLLFNDNLLDSCDSAGPEGWNNLTDTDKKLARCEFATEVANDIAVTADIIVAKWQEHAIALKQAGTDGSEFVNEHEAVNRLSDALFYIDSSTKDLKLAEPLGLFANSCGSQACPEAVESVFANQSVEHITNNLLSFEKLLTGDGGIGFIEYLIDAGDQITADTMSADVETALTNIQSYDDNLAKTLTDDPDKVTSTHADIKNVTDKLKADFITSLALELPKTSAGDND